MQLIIKFNTKIGKERGNSYQKQIWMKGTHKQTAYLIHFNNHRCLSRSEESKCMWTRSKDSASFTICSYTFTLFWLRKISVIIKTFQLNFRVLVCALCPEIYSFYRKSFIYLFVFFNVIHIRYVPYHITHVCRLPWSVGSQERTDKKQKLLEERKKKKIDKCLMETNYIYGRLFYAQFLNQNEIFPLWSFSNFFQFFKNTFTDSISQLTTWQQLNIKERNPQGFLKSV